MRDESCTLRTRQNSVGTPLIMTRSRAELAVFETPLWFCLRTHPKHEHIAAAGLQRQLNVKCFAPRLRYRKMTRRGAVWFVEAMFPGYLFAQFIYSEQHRRVEYSPGIQGILQFGDYIATVDSETVSALQEQAGTEDIVTIDPDIKVGQSVRIAEGPLRGLEAIVTRVLPARERIRVLLELLGGQVEAEVSSPKVVPLGRPRLETRTGNGSI